MRYVRRPRWRALVRIGILRGYGIFGIPRALSSFSPGKRSSFQTSHSREGGNPEGCRYSRPVRERDVSARVRLGGVYGYGERAERNPENPANPVNPDSGKAARSSARRATLARGDTLILTFSHQGKRDLSLAICA